MAVRFEYRMTLTDGRTLVFVSDPENARSAANSVAGSSGAKVKSLNRLKQVSP